MHEIQAFSMHHIIACRFAMFQVKWPQYGHKNKDTCTTRGFEARGHNGGHTTAWRPYCFDNAMMESFFSSLEAEVLDRYRFRTREEARGEIFSWIEGWYNTHRRHSGLGYVSPREFERRSSQKRRRARHPDVLLPPPRETALL